MYVRIDIERSHLFSEISVTMISANKLQQDSLPEWSKGVDSSSTSASCVGSNPTAVISSLVLSCGANNFYLIPAGCFVRPGKQLMSILQASCAMISSTQSLLLRMSRLIDPEQLVKFFLPLMLFNKQFDPALTCHSGCHCSSSPVQVQSLIAFGFPQLMVSNVESLSALFALPPMTD